MPYVNIKVTDERVTQAQKQTLIKETTEMLSRVLDKDPATTFVVIELFGSIAFVGCKLCWCHFL